MPDQTPPPGISQEDWAATPVAVRVLVTELLQRVVRLEGRLNHIPADLVVTSCILHDDLDISTRYPHRVSSADET